MPQVPRVVLRVTFDACVPGTVCRFSLESYDYQKRFDAIVVSLWEGKKKDTVKCLIIGFDTGKFDVRTGETVELPQVELRSFEMKSLSKKKVWRRWMMWSS